MAAVLSDTMDSYIDSYFSIRLQYLLSVLSVQLTQYIAIEQPRKYYSNMWSVFLTFSLCSPLTVATPPPVINGMKLLWQDSFLGCAGCSPDFLEWTAVALPYVRTNNELQTYTSLPSNLQLSGNQTLRLIPWEYDQSWTSARIESVRSWTPSAGKITQVQASFRTTVDETGGQQGMWPAFWMLGDSYRRELNPTFWPHCGEIDIFEQINGDMMGYGTIHCDESPECGLSRGVIIPDNDFHTWALRIDRTSGNWQTETLELLLDGTVFFSMNGIDIGNQETWSILAQSPLYLILNLAVGGNYPVTCPIRIEHNL